MTDLALHLLRDALDSFAEKDGKKAIEVRDRDEEIDSMYTSLFRELLTYMMEDPGTVAFGIHLLFCAKNIERMGDHATNIAEAVYYMIEGHCVCQGAPEGGHDQRNDDRTSPPATNRVPALPRYAIYFVPPAETEFFRFGSAVLGYDCYTGGSVKRPAILDAEPELWDRLTAEPRRYGFHATLKAPFNLSPSCREAQLVSALHSFAGLGHAIPALTPAVRMLSGFAADRAGGRLAGAR